MSNKLFSKNFTILILGQIISLFGSSIQRFAMSLYLLDLTGSASVFATILAISMIPIVLISPIAGILADRGNKKRLMVLLDVISGILLIGYAVIVFKGQDQTIIITLVMVILSTITTIYQPIVNTCIPVIVEKENLVRANALIQQVSSLSNFLGPIFAGVLYGFFGIMGVIILNIISFLFSALLELFLTIPHQKQKLNVSFTTIFIKDMKESYSYLKDKNKIVFRMLLISGLYNLFLVPVFSVAAPYLIKITFGLSAQIYGLAEAAIALGMIVGGLIITWKPLAFHIKKVHSLLYLSTLAMLLMGVSVYFYQTGFNTAISAVIWFTLSGMIIMGVLGIANVLTASFLYKEIDPTLLGKILAFGSAFATLCVPIGQILFGGLIEVFETQIYLLIGLAALCVGGVTTLVRWNVLQIKDDEKTS